MIYSLSELEIKKKIESRGIKIGLVGLGRIGLPLAATLADRGFQVLGIDINNDVVSKINAGESPYPDEVGLPELITVDNSVTKPHGYYSADDFLIKLGEIHFTTFTQDTEHVLKQDLRVTWDANPFFRLQVNIIKSLDILTGNSFSNADPIPYRFSNTPLNTFMIQLLPNHLK